MVALPSIVDTLQLPSVSEPFLAWTISGEVDFQEREYKFKRAMAVSPARYHINLRMNVARRLLRETKKGVVADIATPCSVKA
jgi:transcriptional regulator GlxA family with amidase domain